MNTRILFIHTWTPLHAGTGQSIGAIDLTIAREKATGIPFLPGSSLKGVLRDRMEGLDGEACRRIYGSDPRATEEQAGCLMFGDARLLCMPVRSMAGTFCYATSPYLLHRMARDLRETGVSLTVPEGPDVVESVLVSNTSSLVMNGEVIFEDLKFQARAEDAVSALASELGNLIFGAGEADKAARDGFGKRLAVLHDDVMAYLLEQATEVSARIAIDDETKTVQKGALWYEESLPAESILASLLVAVPNAKAGMSPNQIFDELQRETEQLIQLGGNATIGRGQCRLSLTGVSS